jgi:hypothetical protein
MFAQSHSDRIEIQSLHFENGQCRKLSIFFGPHHFFEVETVNGKTWSALALPPRDRGRCI